MRRRAAIAVLLALALVAGAREACAARLAVVYSADLPPYAQAGEGLARTVQGNEVVTYTLEGVQEKWLEVERALAAQPPDLVVTVGSLATALASRRLKGVPIVYTMVVNPEKILEPGGAPATGVSLDQDAARAFRAVTEALPGVRKVGVLFDPAQSGPRVEEAKAAAAAAGLGLLPVEVPSARELPEALRRLLDQRPDVVWLLVDRTVLATQEGLELIMLETLQRGVPVVAPSERYAKAGALLALTSDYGQVGEETGRLALRALKSRASGAPLPAAERAESLQTVVNEKVRGTLGVEVRGAHAAPPAPARREE